MYRNENNWTGRIFHPQASPLTSLSPFSSLSLSFFLNKYRSKRAYKRIKSLLPTLTASRSIMPYLWAQPALDACFLTRCIQLERRRKREGEMKSVYRSIYHKRDFSLFVPRIFSNWILISFHPAREKSLLIFSRIIFHTHTRRILQNYFVAIILLYYVDYVITMKNVEVILKRSEKRTKV